MGCPTEVEIGENLTFSICTHDPDTGVLTDADGVPTWRIYEDETAAAILNGDMAKLDDANTTGFYTETVDCSVANGFENGKTYTVYIEATVDGDKGGICYGFKASSKLTTIDTVVDDILVDTGTTIPGTITTIDNEIATIDTVVDTILLDTAELQTDWTNGGRLDLLLDAVKAKTDNLPGAIPKAVALPDFAFVMYSSTDHVTPSTGLTVSGYISKDGGAFAALDGTITAISNGVYQVDSITATEMDADVVVLRFTATGADDVVIVIKTDE